MALPDRVTLIDELKALIVLECDLDIEAGEIATDGRLIGGDLDLDSLDALQVSMAIKAAYGVRIEGGPSARRAFVSVESLADFILDAAAKDA